MTEPGTRSRRAGAIPRRLVAVLGVLSAAVVIGACGVGREEGRAVPGQESQLEVTVERLLESGFEFRRTVTFDEQAPSEDRGFFSPANARFGVWEVRARGESLSVYVLEGQRIMMPAGAALGATEEVYDCVAGEQFSAERMVRGFFPFVGVIERERDLGEGRIEFAFSYQDESGPRGELELWEGEGSALIVDEHVVELSYLQVTDTEDRGGGGRMHVTYEFSNIGDPEVPPVPSPLRTPTDLPPEMHCP